MIPVTQPFLPPKEEYISKLDQLWESKWIANNGVLVQTLEKELISYLNINNLYYVNNGTMALQLAIKSLDLTGEIITTPFSFVATTTSIIWEKCKPVFIDIDPITLCIDSTKIEEAITVKTQAILATHVYGIPCNVEMIEAIAKKHNLKVIYDGAHAFGVEFKGRSIFTYGDISTFSFHATKVFHTVEGGGITCNNNDFISNKVKLLRGYGYENNEHHFAGINAKNTEFHAAMGLSNLQYIESNLLKRKEISELYNQMLNEENLVLSIRDDVKYNYAYYPIKFEDEKQLLQVQNALMENGIQTRRYFYPSLNKLPYLKHEFKCPISESIADKILCLPLYSDLKQNIVKRICLIVNENV